MFSRKRETDARHDHVAADTRTGTRSEREVHEHDTLGGREAAHERFGGVNLGAAFFGWLVAIAMTLLLAGIVGAVATAVSRESDVSRSDAEEAANTIGLVAAIVLVAVLAIAYYAGGYVAGRMSRFDGAKQGLAVFLIGLVVTVIAAVVGALFGREYDVLDRIDLPNVPIPSDDISLGGLVVGLVVLVVTALAAMAGGKVGRNYHKRVDAAHLAG